LRDRKSPKVINGEDGELVKDLLSLNRGRTPNITYLLHEFVPLGASARTIAPHASHLVMT